MGGIVVTERPLSRSLHLFLSLIHKTQIAITHEHPLPLMWNRMSFALNWSIPLIIQGIDVLLRFPYVNRVQLNENNCSEEYALAKLMAAYLF